jgi:DNA-binding transcriptional LysR family regulator
MGKAAKQLHTSQPAISRAITDLEHAFGVRLLDRTRQGVEATKYGCALIACGAAVFDDLHQAVKNIEFLADPTVGEIRVGALAPIIGGLLPATITHLRSKYPRITVHVSQITAVAEQYSELRQRRVDLVVARTPQAVEEDIDAETLFHEHTVVVAGARNKLARRRQITLAQLAGEPWGLPPPESLIGSLVADAFRASGIEFPRRGVTTGSIHMLSELLASGPILAVFPGSVLRFATNMPPLKALPVKLPIPPWPVGVMTLKNRMITPAAELFVECIRDIAKPLTKRS